MLASLVDSHNNILVPGFYANVRPNMLAAALQRLEGSREFSLEGWGGQGAGWGRFLQACGLAAACRSSAQQHGLPNARSLALAPCPPLNSYKQHLGVAQLTAGRSEQDLLNARWCQPSLRCGGSARLCRSLRSLSA